MQTINGRIAWGNQPARLSRRRVVASAAQQSDERAGPLPTYTRRRVLGATIAAGTAATLTFSSSRAAKAEEEVASSSSVEVPAAPVNTTQPRPPPRNPLRLEDTDFFFDSPVGYRFIDTQTPAPERGPAPEQSPIRARVDSPDGTATVSVLVRGAQTVKSTFLQVNDISAYGTLEETARLLLPRGSTLLSASTETIQLPAKDTPLGVVEGKNTYYRYEFTTVTGLHIFVSAAAQRGRVYVCSATVPKGAWDAHRAEVIPSVLSFRLKAIVLGPK